MTDLAYEVMIHLTLMIIEIMIVHCVRTTERKGGKKDTLIFI